MMNMRNESEMLNLIIETAKEDPRIRAAYLEGSRVNPKISKDIFQDYDVVYIVNETRSFIEDKSWINRFGERLFMQVPEDTVYSNDNIEESYGWLMQFKDGNRLDLHVTLYDKVKCQLELYKVLVDKDGLFAVNEQTNDEIYWIKKPTEDEFLCTSNEFWWCLDNVAKGLWRDEIPYVLDMIDFNIRPMLKRLIEWRIGIDYNFSISAGKSCKYMKDLSPEYYQHFLKTYAVADREAIWQSVFVMCDLFNEIALGLANRLTFTFNIEEAKNCMKYLKDIYRLPADAKEIY